MIQVLLVPFHLAAGPAKHVGAEQMIEFFDEIGAGRWLRYLTGTVEVIGALGLLVPRLTGLAAPGLTGLMTGAEVGAPGSTAVCLGRRSVTAVRMAPRLTSWSRARVATDRPSR
ncbi:DoxX family protein [Streptomyces atratus]|uniref:DoxX family protein n=1 Tax=Streptomyces atratus TaxID=1893 RepID=UPI0033C9260B